MTRPQLAVVASSPTHPDAGFEATLDLAMHAGVARGERVEVVPIAHRTQELFEQTFNLLQGRDDDKDDDYSPGDTTILECLPQADDLRRRFVLAEALGSYSTLNDLLDLHSPGRMLSERCRDRVKLQPLTENEMLVLEEYLNQINESLKHAQDFLRQHGATVFSSEELLELNDLLTAAKQRSELVTAILGEHLIHEIEAAVRKLHVFHEKLRSVQHSINGIFLVDSEVMFIPANELVRCVQTVFKGVGNPYLADNIDGIMLLAARNLLIETVAFFSYYGKQRIYSLFKQQRGPVNQEIVTYHIRREIQALFDACKEDNKLVLKRMMNDAEREFVVSVETIQREAEKNAVQAVIRLVPPPAQETRKVAKPGFVKRLMAMFRL